MRPGKFLAIVLLLWQAAGHSQNFTSRHFTAADGLPDLYVYCSFQDSEGFLWSATTKGLVRFDGQVFANFSPKLEEGDFIYSGAADKTGRLWFGTFSGRIFTYVPQTGSLSAFSSTITGSVDRIIPSADNKSIYFISKGSGIYTLSGKNFSQIPFSQVYQVNGAIEIEKGVLLLATPEGLYKAEIEKQLVKKIKGCDNDVTQIHALRSGHKLIMALSEKGLAEGFLNPGMDSISVKPLPDPWGLAAKGISAFCWDESYRLAYIVTRDEVFSCIDYSAGNIKALETKEYQATANSILLDKDRNIWISTAGKGLYRLFREEYGFISVNNGPVYAIARSGSRTYFATDEGVEVMDSLGNFEKPIKQADNVKLDRVNALYHDGSRLWIGTGSKGLVVIDPLTLQTVKIEMGTVGNISVNAITGSRSRREVYVGTNLDGAYIYNNYDLKHHFSVQNSLLHNNVYYALGCNNNKVYYATHNTGINFSKGDQVFEINMGNNGLISDFNNFAESPKGQLAVGTNGDGVYFLNDTVVAPMPSNNELESKFCNTLSYDASGDLWIATRYSLYKYYTQREVLKKIEFGNDNSMLFNPNSFYCDPAGEMMFGTSKNVLVLKEGNKAAALPKSYILSVKILDSVITALSKPVFKNGKYDASFEFSALCLHNSESVRFSYILEGRDSKWTEPGTAREAEFFNLSEGDYVLKVKAFNSDGYAEAEPATYAFTIAAPVWKKAWFWMIILVLLALAVYLIVRVRTAALIKAKIRLEKIVDEKTRELREEKQLVEAKNEIIEEQNRDITSSIRYAQRIQEAILPDRNLDDKVRSSIFVYYIPKDIVSGDFYWIAEKNGRYLFAACDCTGHGVPGAFMSLIGTTLLNKIVFDNDESDTAKIISGMDREVSKSLKQEDTEVNDGMEAGLCSIDFESRTIMYTGAKRPLFLYRKTAEGYVLEEIKPDKFPIGGFASIKDKSFTTHTITAGSGDILYMFSDGLIDQFNENNTKRFSSRQLREVLQEMAGQHITGQWYTINRKIAEWKGNGRQTDDILLLGVRL